MAKGKLLLGLDIGSNSAKICLLKDGRSNYELVHVDREALPFDAIVDGSILERTAVVRALKTLLNRNRIKQRQCAIAISGNSVIVKRLRLANMTDAELAENIRWDVEQQIPYEFSEVVFDTVVLSRSPQQNSMDILLVASKREVVNDYISVVQEAGLDVRVVDIASFALQNMIETVYGAADRSTCTGIINVGASVTSISMMTGGITTFTRDISIGGNQITEEIQKRLSISREEAEGYKTGSTVGSGTLVPKEVDEITRQLSEMIGNEIKRSLQFFYETSGRDGLDELYMCGGVMKDSSTLGVIEEVLGERIKLVNPFSNMRFNQKLYTKEYLDKLSLDSAVAVGLALRRTVE